MANGARYTCFDCGNSTGAPMSVFRMLGPEDAEYRSLAFVHRNGQGCHVALTAAEVRDGVPHRHHAQLRDVTALADGTFLRFCAFDGERF